MTICKELEYLEKVQKRVIRLCKYIEKHHPDSYNDLYIRLGCVVGTIEDALNFDEGKY